MKRTEKDTHKSAFVNFETLCLLSELAVPLYISAGEAACASVHGANRLGKAEEAQTSTPAFESTTWFQQQKFTT